MEPKWTDAVNVPLCQQGWSWLENCEKTGRERILIMQIFMLIIYIIKQHALSQVLSTYAFLKDFT